MAALVGRRPRTVKSDLVDWTTASDLFGRSRPARRPGWAILAAILIVAPHLYGAPQPAEHAAATPDVLMHRFVVAVTLVSLLFWLALGAATGYFYRRFEPRTG